MPSDVPKAREIVDEVLNGLRPLDDLAEALKWMTRDKYIRHAKIESNAVTKEIRDAVRRDYAGQFAGLSRKKMGQRYNIGSGRVTEIEQGKYDSL